MKVAAVVLCAGSSQRFGRDKLALDLSGMPVWRRSVQAFLDHPEVTIVKVVHAPGMRAQGMESLELVEGGSSRQESARNGLMSLPSDTDLVLFHDGARPFVSPDLISRVIAAATKHGAAVPAVPVTDTVKQVGPEGQLTTLDRNTLIAVQTPQAATYELWCRAFQNPEPKATDDVSLLERMGVFVSQVPGDRSNIKLTTENDYVEALMRSLPREIRTGMGYDIHSFSSDPNRPLTLGGVHFPEGPGLEGHSDADVLLHAITDAILGAAALDDIGVHFPNSDPEWKGKESTHFLKHAGNLLAEEGWQIQNIDATILAERPRVMPRRHDIRNTIASCLGLQPEQVSVKATTNEKLGAIGRGEGIAAMAVATIFRPMGQRPCP